MKVITEIDVKINIRKHKVIGILNKSLLLKKLNEIYSDPDFQPGMNSFWNFSSADLTSFSIEDTEEVANFVKKKWTSAGQTKAALVAPELFANRLTQIYAKRFDGHASSNVKIF